MKNLWKKFDELSEMCYENMITGNGEFQVWNDTFDALLDVIHRGRENDPDYAKELLALDDSTDFEHDVCTWVEDYLDELGMKEQYDKLLHVCDTILNVFAWKEDDASDIRFQKADALEELGRTEEELKMCEEWYAEATDNPIAAVALIHARIAVKDLNGAEELVKKYISDDSVCTEDNDIIFYAASGLYRIMENKEAEARVDAAIAAYEKEVDEYLAGLDDEDMGFDDMDEELPFN